MKILFAVCLALVAFENVLTYDNLESADVGLRELLNNLKRMYTPTTDSPVPDDDTGDNTDDIGVNTDDTETDDKRPPGILHELRGSCDIISAAGPRFFHSFPEGPVWDHVITFRPENFTDAFSMFVKVAKLSRNKRVYIRALIDKIGFHILHERSMCPGVKLQQALMYMLRKELNRQLATEDDTLYTNLLTLYTPIFGDMAEAYAHGSVRYAHAIIFEEIIDFLLRSELKGLIKMAEVMDKMIRKKVTIPDMTMTKWMRVMKVVLKRFKPSIQCPTPDRVLKIYTELIDQVKLRFADDIIKNEAVAVMESLMRENMDFSRVTDPKQFLSDAMGVFMRYVEKMIARFDEFERNLKERTLWKMEDFIRQYLSDEQLGIMGKLIEWLFPDNEVQPTPA